MCPEPSEGRHWDADLLGEVICRIINYLLLIISCLMYPAALLLLNTCCVTPLYCHNSIQQIVAVACPEGSEGFGNSIELSLL